MSVGVSSSDISDEIAVRQLYLVQYDRGGHVVRERQLELSGLDNVAGVVRIDDSLYAGVNAYQDKGQKLAKVVQLSLDGEILKQHSFDESGAVFTLNHLRKDKDGQILVSLKREDKKVSYDFGNVNFTLDKDLKQIRRRLYMPGTPNMFNSVNLNPDGSLVGAGSVSVETKLDDSLRHGGWLVNLDEKGSIYWQKSYARGAKAELVAAGAFGDVGYAAAGTAWPSLTNEKAKHSALWVMLTDINGETLWQRFITGREQYSYEAVDMHIYEDGRIAVLANATALKQTEKIRSHIRIITFTPQGTILEDQAYVEGANSRAHGWALTQEGQYRIYGELNTGYAESDDEALMDKEQKEEEEMSALDKLRNTSLESMGAEVGIDMSDGNEEESLAPKVRAWLLAVARPEDYKNPCR